MLLLALTAAGCGAGEPARGHDAGPELLDVIAEAAPDEGNAPLEVVFAGRVRGEVGARATHRWDFGDGGTARAGRPRHVYERAGRFVARLTVRDEDGRHGHDEVEVLVDPPHDGG